MQKISFGGVAFFLNYIIQIFAVNEKYLSFNDKLNVLSLLSLQDFVEGVISTQSLKISAVTLHF